jgi:hypothetical protein
MNYLVETKKEYTTQLVNIISPFIFDGIQSLYEEACKVSKDNEELKIFQNFLKKIPGWNPLILEAETGRILKESNCEDLLPQLLSAVIKSNIMVLTNTPPERKNSIKLPKDIDFQRFIHFAYIETAKSIYENPYLFYHKFSVFDVKKNQRDAKDVIKTSIHEAIRKLLPLQYILKEYLVEESTAKPHEQDFDKSISEANKSVLKQMMKKQDLEEPSFEPSSGVVNQFDKIKQMLKNDPLDDIDSITESIKPKLKKSSSSSSDKLSQPVPSKHTESAKQKVASQTNPPYVLKKLDSKPTQQPEPEISESVAYYKNNGTKLIDSFSNNRSNIRSVFYSNEPDIAKQQAVNTADVENYLKEQGQTTLKMSDDPNINSIKNVNPDKFKNKYYQV